MQPIIRLVKQGRVDGQPLLPPVDRSERPLLPRTMSGKASVVEALIVQR